MAKGQLTDIEVRQQSQDLFAQSPDSSWGILPEFQDKILLPFFTTNLPGEESRLGVDIGQMMLAKHQGTKRQK
jgi:nitrogen-specific signal transduction histidine kinase